jgi:hypothetical protein
MRAPNRAGVNGFTVLAPIDDVTLELSAGGTTTAIPLRQLVPGPLLRHRHG